MRILVLVLLIFFVLLAGHRENRPSHQVYAVNNDAPEFPLLIEGGTKIVYQVGQMTPRGLKLHLDTADYKPSRVVLPEIGE